MAKRRRVVIIGGGVTGLATAHALAKGERGGEFDIILLERSARLGGNIVTERRDEFILDGGPDSWVVTKPHATALAKKMGMQAELVETVAANRHVFVVWNDRLHPLPEGLVLGVPTQISPMLKTHLFSWPGKLRMGLEPFIARRESDEDESIADFIERRLGHEACDRLVAPLLGGIFAGDAKRISIQATFPQFVEMERKYGSLIRASRATKRPTTSGKSPSAFLSVRSGLSTFVDSIANASGVTIRHVGASSVDRSGQSEHPYVVVLENGDRLFVDEVVLAGPAHMSSRLLQTIDSKLSSILDSFEYVSTATAFFAFRREQVAHALDATGFIVPRVSGRPILAATFVSSKWPGRAPAGSVLIRTFFGGAWGEDVLSRDDNDLAKLGLQELNALVPIQGEPLFSQIFRFNRANPQPRVGHAEKIASMRAREESHLGLHIAGSGFDGIGIGDCIRQAETVAQSIRSRVA